ncbi:MAG: DUF433 domain-containing protein [bacterium]
MQDRIIIDEGILAGKPVIRGTRISVELILELFSSGMGADDIRKEYPQLQREDILAALKYATRTLQRQEIFAAT